MSIFNPIPVTAKIDLDSNLNNYYLDKEQTVPLTHSLTASIQVNRQRQLFDSDEQKPRVSLERLAQTFKSPKNYGRKDYKAETAANFRSKSTQS